MCKLRRVGSRFIVVDNRFVRELSIAGFQCKSHDNVLDEFIDFTMFYVSVWVHDIMLK